MLNRMKTRTALALVPTLLVLAACGTAASPSGGAPVAGDESNAPSVPAASVPNEAGASLELPDIETDFPPACDVLASADLEPIVGNDLADGVALTNLICDWESDAEETSVALLFQPVPAEFCGGALDGTPTEQFGGPGSISYSDAGSIPGAQAGVCLDPGLVLVTITGGFGADSGEDRYTSHAVDVMELVLSRLAGS